MVEVTVRRADCAKRRRLEILRAVQSALQDPSIGVRADPGTLRRLATGILDGIRDASTHVVVGRGDFSANLRFAKKSLLYAVVKAKSKAPSLRVLVYNSLPLANAVDGAQMLAFESMRDEHDEPPIASKKKDLATCVSDVEGIPHTIVNSALKVLNDTDIGRDDNDERATALRDELTKKFGSFWHVVSDTGDFAVASRATALPVQNGAHGETKRVSMRFKKGGCEYEVWHHVAPFDRFGLVKMTWAEKARYARYALILAGGGAVAWYKSKCISEPKGISQYVCRVLPLSAPLVLGLFIFFVVSAHVDTSAWKKLERKKSD
jgi:hypothetical protein